MERLLSVIDRLSAWVGKAFAWSIVVLTAIVSYEVFARYLLHAPTDWAYDTAYMLYGTLFMMAGAYTLSRNGHVRGDVLYRRFSARWQAAIDLVLYLLFFFPGVIALVYAGMEFASLSWRMNEHVSSSPGGPPLYHFKAVIPLAGFFLALQGFAESVRCVQCLRTGQWPPRTRDVKELEQAIVEEIHEGKSGTQVLDEIHAGKLKGKSS